MGTKQMIWLHNIKSKPNTITMDMKKIDTDSIDADSIISCSYLQSHAKKQQAM